MLGAGGQGALNALAGLQLMTREMKPGESGGRGGPELAAGTAVGLVRAVRVFLGGKTRVVRTDTGGASDGKNDPGRDKHGSGKKQEGEEDRTAMKEIGHAMTIDQDGRGCQIERRLFIVVDDRRVEQQGLKGAGGGARANERTAIGGVKLGLLIGNVGNVVAAATILLEMTGSQIQQEKNHNNKTDDQKKKRAEKFHIRFSLAY